MFAFGETFTRLRAPLATDAYSGLPTGHDWPNATETPIDGFGFDPGGSVLTDTVNRTQVTTTPTLIWSGSDVPDVQIGDRMRGPDGVVWQITGHPAIPQHPMTGWRPGATWPLELVEG